MSSAQSEIPATGEGSVYFPLSHMMYLLVQTLREMDPSVSTHLIPSNEHSTNGAENERNTCSSALIPVHNFSIVALSSF